MSLFEEPSWRAAFRRFIASPSRDRQHTSGFLSARFCTPAYERGFTARFFVLSFVLVLLRALESRNPVTSDISLSPAESANPSVPKQLTTTSNIQEQQLPTLPSITTTMFQRSLVRTSQRTCQQLRSPAIRSNFQRRFASTEARSSPARKTTRSIGRGRL
jgi:hypothetical protein